MSYQVEPFLTSADRNARWNELRSKRGDVVRYSQAERLETGGWHTVYYVAYPPEIIETVEDYV